LLEDGHCHLGNRAEVYDAKLHAVQEAVMAVLNTTAPGVSVFICIDNQAAPDTLQFKNLTTNMRGEPLRSLTTSSVSAGTSPPFGAPPTAIFVVMRGPTLLPKQRHPPQSPATSHLPPRPGFSPRHGRHSSSDGSTSSHFPILHSNFLTTYTVSTGKIPVQCGGCFATDHPQTHHPIFRQTHAHTAST